MQVLIGHKTEIASIEYNLNVRAQKPKDGQQFKSYWQCLDMISSLEEKIKQNKARVDYLLLPQVDDIVNKLNDVLPALSLARENRDRLLDIEERIAEDIHLINKKRKQAIEELIKDKQLEDYFTIRDKLLCQRVLDILDIYRNCRQVVQRILEQIDHILQLLRLHSEKVDRRSTEIDDCLSTIEVKLSTLRYNISLSEADAQTLVPSLSHELHRIEIEVLALPLSDIDSRLLLDSLSIRNETPKEIDVPFIEELLLKVIEKIGRQNLYQSLSKIEDGAKEESIILENSRILFDLDCSNTLTANSPSEKRRHQQTRKEKTNVTSKNMQLYDFQYEHQGLFWFEKDFTGEDKVYIERVDPPHPDPIPQPATHFPLSSDAERRRQGQVRPLLLHNHKPRSLWLRRSEHRLEQLDLLLGG